MNVLVITQKVDYEDDLLGFFHEWLRRLANRVDRVDVICLENGRTDLPKNVRVFPLHGSKPYKLAKMKWRIFRLAGKSDVIFCHMSPIFTILAYPYAKLYHKKLVTWHTHGAVTYKLRLAVRLTDKVLTASEGSLRVNTHKKVVIGHGIDIDKFKPAEKKNKGTILLSVGRLSRIKGYEELIRGLKELLKTDRQAELRIVGKALNDAYLGDLKELAKKLGIAKNVVFKNEIGYDKMDSVYNDCNIFVSASQTGSLDKVVLEAMACGKPVLTSNPACRGLFGRYDNDMTFEGGNPKDFADKARRLLSLPQAEREEMGRYLRAIVEKDHSLDSFIEKLVNELKGKR